MTHNTLKLDIAVVFDSNFIKHFYVLATSIFENNENNTIHFHAITLGVNEKEKNELKSFSREYDGDILFYDITEEQKEMVIMPKVAERYTIITFYRLFFPLLLEKKIDKFLYLDTDIIVTGNLSDLFNISLEDKPFGAVLDPGDEIRTDLGINKKDNYFNAGVLLVDIKTWNQRKITERALDFLNKFPERCKYVDQDTLNAVAIDDWKMLDPKFNVLEQYVPNLRKSQCKDFVNGTVIVHFNRLKPWDRLCSSKLKYLYYYYFKISPVSKKKMFNKFSFTYRNLYLFIKFRIKGNYYLKNLLKRME